MLNRAHENSRIWKHYNVFYRISGEIDEIKCVVCGSVCNVERSQVGATSLAGAMAKVKTSHDRFYCPHNDEQWHWESLAMVQELEDTYSPSLRKIIQKDIDKSVKENL